MLIKRLYFIATALLTFSVCSCGESYPDHPWEWDQETEEEESNPDIVSQGWTAADNFGNLPDYIHIYKSPENLTGKKAIAYIAVADMSKAKFEVLGDIAFSQEANGYGSKSIHTPSEFYESSKAPVIINGGLFFYSAGFYYSQNLVIREGQILALQSELLFERLGNHVVSDFRSLLPDEGRNISNDMDLSGIRRNQLLLSRPC
ncbi:hypothetical protein NXY28_06245 [Bacteroides thetaiotaomicron]|nr:hypothetical protein NXY28_06245 [Bacteroides thetaiotaomicron]